MICDSLYKSARPAQSSATRIWTCKSILEFKLRLSHMVPSGKVFSEIQRNYEHVDKLVRTGMAHDTHKHLSSIKPLIVWTLEFITGSASFKNKSPRSWVSIYDWEQVPRIGDLFLSCKAALTESESDCRIVLIELARKEVNLLKINF